MFYIRTIDPRTTTKDTYEFVTLMNDYSLDELIRRFIKKSVKMVGFEELLYEATIPHSDPLIGKFFLEKNEGELIGFMIWVKSKITEKAVLVVTRHDRGDNVYFYDIKAKLLKHDTHQ